MISIHALLAESDCLRLVWHIQIVNFYPRSPCGERRKEVNNGRFRQNISIHALLAESDIDASKDIIKTASNFYPRSPCGERLYPMISFDAGGLFLSTLSLRRATPETTPSE